MNLLSLYYSPIERNLTVDAVWIISLVSHGLEVHALVRESHVVRLIIFRPAVCAMILVVHTLSLIFASI